MFYVYLHIEKDTDQPFYVGKGRGKRLNQDTSRAYSWHEVAIKHGWYADIIEEFENEVDAFQCEKDAITFFGRRDLRTGILVNMTAGGKGTPNVSEKVRVASRERILYDNPAKRPEAKIKMSLAAKARHQRNPNRLSEIGRLGAAAASHRGRERNGRFCVKMTQG